MTELNLLDLIPERIVKFEQTADGFVTILKPKFRNKLLVKHLLPRMKSPNFKVNLDEFGSFVWLKCDGKNTVGHIGEQLKEKFSEDVEPVYERLAEFIYSLARYRFIVYKNTSGEYIKMG